MLKITRKLDNDELEAHPSAKGAQSILVIQHYTEDTVENAINLNAEEADDFDGSSTAATVFVVSTEAADDGTIKLRGIAAGIYAEEDVVLTGTTPVESETEWQRLWPPVLDVAQTGTVTVVDAAGVTATYYTIAIGATYANGSKLWVPTGWDAVVDEISVTPLTNAGGLSRGVVLAITGAGFDDACAVTFGFPYLSHPPRCFIKFRNSDDGSITITQRYIAGVETFSFIISIIMKER